MAGTETASTDVTKSRIEEIWLIGLGELHAKTGRVDHWSYYGELQDIKQRPLSVDWLEASIAMAVIGRIRPARVIGYMKKLRARRESLGQSAEFEEFDALLRTYLAPDRLTNHGFKPGTFADLDHQTVWEQVKSHLSVLSDEGYDVFLNSGTLLGVVRDKRLIDHDDDIDLALVLKSKNAADAAQEWRQLRDRLDDLSLFDHDAYKGSVIFKLNRVDNVLIDLFPAWEEDGKFFVYPHTNGELSRDDVLPLRMCELTGHALPANPEKMLELNYGSKWRDPDPLFKFPWAAANEAFSSFIEKAKS